MTVSRVTSWNCAGCEDCVGGDEESGREGNSVLGGVVPSSGSDPGPVECDLEE